MILLVQKGVRAPLYPNYDLADVRRAFPISNDLVYSAVRFSLGRFTTEAEIDYTVAAVVEAVCLLR